MYDNLILFAQAIYQCGSVGYERKESLKAISQKRQTDINTLIKPQILSDSIQIQIQI